MSHMSTMIEKVKVVLKDGSVVALPTWQGIYGLSKPESIGKYFSLNEWRFTKDIVLYDDLVVNEVLMRFVDGFHEKVDQPVRANSFNRSEEHQASMQKEGFRAATVSPHVAKMAMDIDTNSRQQTKIWVAELRREIKSSGIQARIGWKIYMEDGNTFIHIDVCPEFYAPGKPFHHHPHPAVWEKAIEW